MEKISLKSLKEELEKIRTDFTKSMELSWRNMHIERDGLNARISKLEAKNKQGISIVFIYIAFSFFWALLIATTWNYSLTPIFGLKEIGYWQAFALYWTVKLLLGR